MEVTAAKITEELERIIARQEFHHLALQKFEKLPGGSASFNFGPLIVLVHSNGDIEFDGSIFQHIIEQPDYRSLDEALSKVRSKLRYVDEHFSRLQASPELWQRPLLNRLIDWVGSIWTKR